MFVCVTSRDLYASTDLHKILHLYALRTWIDRKIVVVVYITPWLPHTYQNTKTGLHVLHKHSKMWRFAEGVFT